MSLTLRATGHAGCDVRRHKAILITTKVEERDHDVAVARHALRVAMQAHPMC